MSFDLNFNLNMYGLLYKNFTSEKVRVAREKLKNGELKIEDILKEQELVSSFDVRSVCQLQDALTKENILKLIKNVINMPEDEDYNTAYKFPYNSCEILSSSNYFLIEKFFESYKKPEKSAYNYDLVDENDSNLKIDKFYANSEDKKLNLKKMDVISGGKKEKEKEKNIANINSKVDKEDETLSLANAPFQKNNEKKEVVKDKENNSEEEDKQANSLDKSENDNKENNSLINDESQEKIELPQVPNEAESEKANSECNANSIKNTIESQEKQQTSSDVPEIEEKDLVANKIENRNNNEEKTEFDELLANSKYPLLEYFFTFINTDEELDHVLCGYFFQIFNNLFVNKTVQIVKFLFERPEIILSMVNHFNRISIINCLIKLIKYDTDSIILFDKKSCDEVKEEVFKEIFDYVDNRLFNSDEIPEVEILHCISEFFLECLEDKRTFIFFIKCPKFSLKLFETFLHPTLSKHIFVITRYLEKVYLELTYKPNSIQESKSKGLTFRGGENINSNYSADKDEDNSLECYYFLELFTSMIDYLFSRFKDESYGMWCDSEKEMDTTFGERQKKLGLCKLQIMNLIHQILKHTFFVHENKYFNYEEDFFIEFYEKIILSDFFSIAVKYFFEFPWNNMYQNVFLDIIFELIEFSSFNKTLVEHVLHEIGFLEEIILCVIDEKYSCISKFQFRQNEIQNGFLTFIIEIAYKIKQHSTQNHVLTSIIEKSKFLF